MRIFEAIFNYSIISPPLVLKPQSGEIGGAYFRVSTVVGNSQKNFLVSNSSKVCLMVLGHDNHATTKGL